MNTFPLVLSSPSGGGKSTIKDEILKSDKRFGFSITATTRPKRDYEVDGRDYYFVSEKEFDRMIKNDEFIEWAEVHRYRYGTPKSSLLKIIEENKIPIMTIDVVGALNVKKIFPKAVLIFLLPPNPQVMIERLKKRGESDEEIKIRINTATKELEYSYRFDYLVVNDVIKDCVNEIINIVNAEFKKVYRNENFIKDFKYTLNQMFKTEGSNE
jgi:guanylate kinase